MDEKYNTKLFCWRFFSMMQDGSILVVRGSILVLSIVGGLILVYEVSILDAWSVETTLLAFQISGFLSQINSFSTLNSILNSLLIFHTTFQLKITSNENISSQSYLKGKKTTKKKLLRFSLNLQNFLRTFPSKTF